MLRLFSSFPTCVVKTQCHAQAYLSSLKIHVQILSPGPTIHPLQEAHGRYFTISNSSYLLHVNLYNLKAPLVLDAWQSLRQPASLLTSSIENVFRAAAKKCLSCFHLLTWERRIAASGLQAAFQIIVAKCCLRDWLWGQYLLKYSTQPLKLVWVCSCSENLSHYPFPTTPKTASMHEAQIMIYFWRASPDIRKSRQCVSLT